MALRALRSKLSERIFTHVMDDVQIRPHHLVKGLPPRSRAKIASLGRRDFAIHSTMPVKNTSNSQSGCILIDGRRNFSSGPPVSEKIPKIAKGNKRSIAPDTEKLSGGEEQCETLWEKRLQKIADHLGLCGLGMTFMGLVMNIQYAKEAYNLNKFVDEALDQYK